MIAPQRDKPDESSGLSDRGLLQGRSCRSLFPCPSIPLRQFHLPPAEEASVLQASSDHGQRDARKVPGMQLGAYWSVRHPRFHRVPVLRMRLPGQAPPAREGPVLIPLVIFKETICRKKRSCFLIEDQGLPPGVRDYFSNRAFISAYRDLPTGVSLTAWIMCFVSASRCTLTDFACSSLWIHSFVWSDGRCIRCESISRVAFCENSSSRSQIIHSSFVCTLSGMMNTGTHLLRIAPGPHECV